MDNEWPSERVNFGGIFHQRNVNYSKETHEMIKTLMNEARMTTLQRSKINYFLRQGSALPQPEMPANRKLPSEEYEMRRARELMDRSRVVRKRSLDTIKKSGILEIERYVPKVTSRNNDKAKQQLQERMSGLKEYPELDKLTLKTKDKHRTNDKILSNDRIAELLSEIYERIEWLKEMNELGEGGKHRQVINSQVTERLREIKKLEDKMLKEKLDGLQERDDDDDV